MPLAFVRIATLTVLTMSLAGNAYFFLRPPGRAAPPAAIDRPTREEQAPPAGCVAELEECRRAASVLARTLWENALHQGASDATPPAHVANAGDNKGEPSRDSLCRVAREKLRVQWLEKRDGITAYIAHDLADVGNDAEREATRAADTLGVTGRARQRFLDDFAELQAKRIGEMAPIAGSLPVDWSRLLDGAKSLFDREDALVQEQLGADAMARYKESQTDSRMTVLTMAATYADVDWDDAVR